MAVTPIRAGLDDRRLLVAPFEVSLGSLGRIRVGTPEAHPLVQLRTLYPPELERVDVRLTGSGLALPEPLAGLHLGGGSLDLRLAGPNAAGRFVLAGSVTVPSGGYQPAPDERPAPSLRGSRGSALDRLVRRLWLDLTLRVHDFHVAAPGPDLTLAVDCLVRGPVSALATSGTVRGRDLYSRAALFLEDVLRGRHLRDCRK
jgi:hypothetical protein